jgi:glycosyltransferase involved in cell wall biosynthesis
MEDKNQKYIYKELSKKILTLGVSKTSYGGMSSVLISYAQCFENMRFIPTWKLGNLGIRIWYVLQAIVRCIFLLSFDRQIKIVHLHGAANASFYRKWIFIKMAKIMGRKVILHEHAANFKSFYEQSKNKQKIVTIINLCEVFIVLSQSWKTYFLSLGIIPEKIYVLNNIVFPPSIIPQTRTDTKLHILFLGEISQRKGIFDLLEVIKLHKNYFQDKIILRIGGNQIDGDIKSFITENNLLSFVKYEGWIFGKKKIECLNWADIYILPSYNEGLPIAILEAMSYSIPIIGTNVGGIPEILHHHKNGILIEPGNFEQIKDALVFFIKNTNKKMEYGKDAYQTVQAFFPHNVFEHLKSIYIDLLNKSIK